MSSYRQILLHIIFRTKNSEKTIPYKYQEDLFRYMYGHLQNMNIKLHQINAHENHVHLLTDINPMISLASYLRDIKTASSLWLKKNKNFKKFNGWADGYAALSYSLNEKKTLINYIKYQREHHNKESFKQELRRLLEECGCVIDARYFP